MKQPFLGTLCRSRKMISFDRGVHIASFALLVVSLPLIFLCAVLLAVELRTWPVFAARRYGKNSVVFTMYKLRTMYSWVDPNLAKSDIQDLDKSVGPFGRYVRRYSIDELPQLVNVLKGDMVLFGPRPAAISQSTLMTLRKASGVASLKPGISGWAQISGRDHLTDEEKVAFETKHLVPMSGRQAITLAWLTFQKVLRGTDVAG